MRELAEVARAEGTTEAELIHEGIERLVHSRLTGPDIPRFARRLGPLTVSEKDRGADAGAQKPQSP